MTRGKPWSVADEKKLREMVEAGRSANEIAGFFGKSYECVQMKIKRLGLNVVISEIREITTTSSACSGELISVESALGKLNAALNELEKPGLSQSETLRLRSIVQGRKVYIEKFAEFLNYRGLEARMIELEGKLGERERRKDKEEPKNP